MIKKVFIATIVIVMLSCSYSFFVHGATLGEQKQDLQEKTEQAEERLEYVQEELSQSVIKIQELDDTIREAQKDIEGLENELSDLQKVIDEKNNILYNLQEKYIKNDQLLQDRLTTMYELGDTTYLDILLRSSSLIDFLSNYYIIQEFIQSDIELLEEIDKEKAEVEKLRSELDEQKASLKVKKAKKEQIAVITQNNITLKQQAIENLSQEEIDLHNKIEEYKNQEAQLEALIQLASSEYEYSGDYTGGVMLWPIAKKRNIYYF